MSQAQLWILGLLVLVLLAEWAAGRHKALYGANDYVVNGLCAFLGFTVRPLLALTVASFIGILLPFAQGSASEWPFWPSFFGVLLAAEFCNYWVHRWSHLKRKNRWLGWIWPLHRTHHSARYVNVLLHFRVNLFWGMVSPLAWVHSIAFYLGLYEAAGLSIILFSAWGVFTHSHFRWDDAIRSRPYIGKLFRGLEHIIVSPGIHHTHHGYGKDGKHYRNFGLLLSVFDWMFGTLHIPDGRPQHYGLPERRPFWAEEVFYPVYQHKWFSQR